MTETAGLVVLCSPYSGLFPVQFQMPATIIACIIYIFKPIPVEDYDGDSGSVLGQLSRDIEATLGDLKRPQPH